MPRKAALTIGNRPTRRQTVLIGSFLALVFPGIGLAILPSIILYDFQPGGLVWVAVWGSMVLPAWYLSKCHRIDGDDVVTDAHAGTVRRPIADVAAIDPAPWRFPAARLTFTDGSRLWAHGPNTASFVDAVLARAPRAENHLPAGPWLRSRRIIWFLVVIAIGFSPG